MIDEVEKCDACGVEIRNDMNLSTVEVGDESEEWCPGCRAASGEGN